MSTTANSQNGPGLDIEWGFWDAQLDTIEALTSGEYDVVNFRGGYGSGKTVLGTRFTMETALDIPKSDNLILAQDSKKGGPTTFKKFFEELPGEDTVPDEGGDAENSPIVKEHNRNENRITLVNGAVVRLGSADKWNRYAGSEFNFVYCDEVAHYETTDLYKLNEMLISRQRTDDGPNVTLWTSTGNGFNQYYDFVERQVTPDDDPLPTRLYNVVADSRNNPFLNEKEKLTRQFAGTSREDEALAGGFAAAEGLVYSDFSRENHIVSEGQANDLIASEERIYGYDAGWDDPRVVVEIAKTDYDQWLVIDSFHQSESQPEDILNPETGDGWLADKPKGPMFCEHEPSHIAKFRQAGWPAIKANKDLDEGIPHVRGRLKLDSAGRPGLLVSDRCIELVQEFMSYQEDHVGKKAAEDHELDSLRYALFTYEIRADTSSNERSGIRQF
jgi:hypothetical protein